MKKFLVIIVLCLAITSCGETKRANNNIEEINSNTESLSNDINQLNKRIQAYETYLATLTTAISSLSQDFGGFLGFVQNFLLSFFQPVPPDSDTDDIDNVIHGPGGGEGIDILEDDDVTDDEGENVFPPIPDDQTELGGISSLE